MLVIGNGRMITRDASSAFFENGAVAMDGNTPNQKFAKEMDGIFR